MGGDRWAMTDTRWPIGALIALAYLAPALLNELLQKVAITAWT
jgi:hypothetical protein